MNYADQYKAAKKADTLRSLKPAFLKLNSRGDQVIGQLKGMVDVDSQAGSGSYKQYIVDTDKGLVKFSMGAATDREVVGQLIMGKVYSFVFEGQNKIAGGRSLNTFDVCEIPPAVQEISDSDDEAPF